MKKIILHTQLSFFWLLIILFPLGHLLRLELVPPLALYPHDVLSILFIGCWMLLMVMDSRRPAVNVFDWWPIVFSVVGLLAWLINYHQFGAESISGLAYLGRFGIFSFFYLALVDTLRQYNIELPVARIFRFWGLSIAIFGLLQYLFMPDTRFLYYFGWDDHLNRLISTLFDPGFTGLMLILGLILELTKTRLNTIVMGIFLLSIVLTFARSAYLTLGIITLLWAIKTKNIRHFIVLMGIFVVMIFLAPKEAGEGVNLARTQSIISRQTSSLNALQVFLENPVLGVGFNNYRLLKVQDTPFPSHSSSPDNSFLLVAATTGIIGLMVFVGGLLVWLLWSLRADLGLFLSLVAISVHSLTNNSWFYPFVLVWIFVLMAYTRSRHKELSINLKFWRH